MKKNILDLTKMVKVYNTSPLKIKYINYKGYKVKVQPFACFYMMPHEIIWEVDEDNQLFTGRAAGWEQYPHWTKYYRLGFHPLFKIKSKALREYLFNGEDEYIDVTALEKLFDAARTPLEELKHMIPCLISTPHAKALLKWMLEQGMIKDAERVELAHMWLENRYTVQFDGPGFGKYTDKWHALCQPAL